MMYSQTFCCSTKVPLSFGIFGYASNNCLMTYTNELGWHGWVDLMLQFWFRLATRLFHFRKAHINHQTKSSSLPSPSPSRRQWKAKVFLKWALKTGCEERGLRYTCDLLKRAYVSLSRSLSHSLSLSALLRILCQNVGLVITALRGGAAVSYVAVMPSAFGDELKILTIIDAAVDDDDDDDAVSRPLWAWLAWRRRRVATSRQLRQLAAVTTLHISTS